MQLSLFSIEENTESIPVDELFRAYIAYRKKTVRILATLRPAGDLSVSRLAICTTALPALMNAG
jgi:hypothetical protein